MNPLQLSTICRLAVAASAATLLGGSSIHAQTPSGVDGAPADDHVTTTSQSSAPKSFFSRFVQAYRDDWNPPAPADATTEAPHRGYPPVVSNPPFPFTVWPIGGTVWLGYNNATSYPLTVA